MTWSQNYISVTTAINICHCSAAQRSRCCPRHQIQRQRYGPSSGDLKLLPPCDEKIHVDIGVTHESEDGKVRSKVSGSVIRWAVRHDFASSATCLALVHRTRRGMSTPALGPDLLCSAGRATSAPKAIASEFVKRPPIGRFRANFEH